jgi:hypothetical protein
MNTNHMGLENCNFWKVHDPNGACSDCINESAKSKRNNFQNLEFLLFFFGSLMAPTHRK